MSNLLGFIYVAGLCLFIILGGFEWLELQPWWIKTWVWVVMILLALAACCDTIRWEMKRRLRRSGKTHNHGRQPTNT